MVDVSVFIYSVKIHPRVEKNLNKWNHLGKNEPNIHHLNIGSGWQGLRNTDEEICENQERGEVDGDNGFKEEILEEVCSVDNDEDEESW